MAESSTTPEPPLTKSKRKRLRYQRKLRVATSLLKEGKSSHDGPVETPVMEPPPGPDVPLTAAQREANYRAVLNQVLGHDPRTIGHAASELPGLVVSRYGRRNMPYETLQRLSRPRTAPRATHMPIPKPLDKSMRSCSVLVMMVLSGLVIAASFATSVVYVVGFLRSN